MIEVIKIEPQTVEVFDPSGKSLGFLNEYEINNLRAQIAENEVAGYYLVFNDKKIEIQSNGFISEWPYGMFDMNEELIARMFRAQKEHRLRQTLNR